MPVITSNDIRINSCVISIRVWSWLSIMTKIRTSRVFDKICRRFCIIIDIMCAITSQITGVSIVCSTVCWGSDNKIHQSSASLAFVRGTTGHWWLSSQRTSYTAETCFHLMTSSRWNCFMCIANIQNVMKGFATFRLPLWMTSSVQQLASRNHW